MLAHRYAAVIGIDPYGHGIAPLRTAAADARAIAAALERDHGFSAPHLLLNEEATGAAILRLLEETLPPLAVTESAVVLYYAGHGVALGDGREGPEGFLLPQDARPGDESTWLSMERVRQALSRLACKHLLVVLDCCFAGSFRWAASRSFVPVVRPLYDSQYERFLAGTAWQVLTSASHQERALDVAPGCRNTRDGGAENGHSPFAAALLRGLAGEADSARGRHESDGVITATELHQLIFEELVPPGTRSRQTPGIWPLRPDNTGELLFLVPGREKKTRPDPPLDDTNNPWLGLKAYGREDASLFFGRERVVEEILARLLDPGRPPLLAVVGASGTGKSSVVRAGLLPRLEGWAVARLPRLQGDPRAAVDEALRELAEAPPGRRRLLFIDQFEELYTQCPDAGIREAFLRRLRELMHGDEPLRVVLTLRSDFEPRLAASDELGPLLAAARYLVPAMTSDELRDVIEEPARAKALFFEPEALVGELADEVMAMPGGLPLLSFALAEMYRQAQLRRRTTGALDRAITRADAAAAGGVVGALHRRAGELYDAVDPARRETVRRLFLRMVSQEGGRLARRRVEARELEHPDPDEQQRVRQVLEEYVAARLLVADEVFVEPAHDTLVLAWDKLLGWLAESGSQELARQLWADASAWEAAQRERGHWKARGLLWNQDPRLPLVQNRYLQGAQPGELNPIEREFAIRSVARRRHRRSLVAGVTAAVILALGVLAGAALWQGRRAEEKARSADRVTAVLKDMFRDLDPYQVAVDENSLPQILDRGRNRVERDLRGEPAAQDGLRGTIGGVYRKLGKLRPAEELLQQVVAWRRRELGEDDPQTLAALHELGGIYHEQSRLQEAEKLLRQAFGRRRLVLGEDDPETLKSMGGLAAVYASEGRLQAAESLLRWILDAMRRTRGDEHPDTFKAMNELATVYHLQGRYPEAEALQRKVLAGRLRVLKDHPDTLAAMTGLANTLSALGRLKEAEELDRRAVARSREALGAEHPETLTYLENLANVYILEVRLDDAEKLHLQVLAARRRVLGEDHLDTLSVLNNLAILDQQRGRFQQAQERFRQVAAVNRRVLGPEHPTTLQAESNLANSYIFLDRYGTAESLHRRLLEQRRRLLGPDHPDTLATLNNLSVVVDAEGRRQEAEELAAQALAGYQRTLGDDYPATIQAKRHLADLYVAGDRLREAGDLYHQALEASSRVLGPEHSETLWTMRMLALLAVKQKRFEEAESLDRQILAVHRRVLGEKNMTTLIAMKDLIDVYRAAGNTKEADALMARATELFLQMPEGKNVS
jgi:tetratricopeptide (TPR) repeat protein